MLTASGTEKLVRSTLKISVIIPTYNRRQMLARTLATLFLQDFPADQWELIVVVDGSTDGTADFLHDLRPACPMQVVEQQHLGLAAARNSGLRAAHGDLVLFLDDDILCDPTLVGKHVGAHEGKRACVVAGPIFVAPESPPSFAADSQQEVAARRASLGGRSTYEVMVGPNTSASRLLLLAHQGYNERFRTHEDVELGIRLRQANVEFHLQHDAIAYHLYTKSTRDLIAYDWKHFAANEILLCRTHPSYRHYSRFSTLNLDSIAWRLVTWLVCKSPVSPDQLLRVPLRVAETFRSVPSARRFGHSLFHQRRASTTLRSAVRYTGSWKAFRREFGLWLPVLRYRSAGLSEPGVLDESLAEAERFEKDIAWLAARGYVGIRPSEWVAWCERGKPLPDKPVLITFDGGCVKLAEDVLPVLRKYGFSAGVFVVTAWIGLENACCPHRMMTAEQIRRWASEGIEFGSYGRTYANLASLERDLLEEEIAGSREELTAIAKEPVRSFAYPYGSCSQSVRGAVAKIYDCAFSARIGLNTLGTDLHALRRVAIPARHRTIDLALLVAFGSIGPWRKRTERVLDESKSLDFLAPFKTGQSLSDSSLPQLLPGRE